LQKTINLRLTLNEVLDNPDLIWIKKLQGWQRREKYSIEDVTSFPIANAAVTDARNQKNVINLDTHIQIKWILSTQKVQRNMLKRLGWRETDVLLFKFISIKKKNRKAFFTYNIKNPHS
jgi:hypothetical protein